MLTASAALVQLVTNTYGPGALAVASPVPPPQAEAPPDWSIPVGVFAGVDDEEMALIRQAVEVTVPADPERVTSGRLTTVELMVGCSMQGFG
eukprot:gene10257-9062_t